MRFGALVMSAVAAGIVVTGCGSTPTGPGNPGGAPGPVNLSSVDICKLFPQSEAQAAMGVPMQHKSSSATDECEYEVVAPADATYGASISVTVRPASRTSLVQAAQALGLTTKVDGIGDEAYSDGKLTLIARKGNTEIQAVFVNFGDDQITVSPLDAMKRAAGDVAKGL